MTHINVEPYAWLRPIYAELRANSAFARLAPASQFLELCRAATEHSSAKAEVMREWNPAAQSALVKHLSDSLGELPHPSRDIELRRVRKGARTLRCVAVYLSIGVDLRLMEEADFRRTELIKQPELVEARLNGIPCCWRKPGARMWKGHEERDRFRKPEIDVLDGSACTPARMWSVSESTAACWKYLDTDVARSADRALGVGVSPSPAARVDDAAPSEATEQPTELTEARSVPADRDRS
jgi:hypothetical protein